ncbi:MAG: chemotaxis protein CheR [Desulfovibrionaceae bacterium]|nr:chemotaxis protein CheR [Desulfovibrionaceae bacterium]
MNGPPRPVRSRNGPDPGSSGPGLPAMTEGQFRSLGGLITARLGIKLPSSKKTMLEARLARRLRSLGLSSWEDYCGLVLGPGGGAEMCALISAVTTNTTSFFREPRHFEILVQTVLPGLWEVRSGGLSVWSAGCSTGEEAYTLAMVLSEFGRQRPGFGFNVLATDVSRSALEAAARAVYPMDGIGRIPDAMRQRYLLRGRGASEGLVRVAPEIRAKVRFAHQNFMDEFCFEGCHEVVFCRNVVIYFDRAVQVRLFRRICARLAPGGYLFIGHSESLAGMDLPLGQAAPTVYRKLGTRE